jgi:thiamine pyrophosphate-dependent acetolactate synthase large subunit-like protein
MGVATVIGLGLALAQPKRRVLVITGDGEMLMGLGTLATIAVQRPANLAIAVIDNECYGETGMQATHTAHGVDLAAVARGCGFEGARVVWRDSGLKAACRALRAGAGPVLVQFKVVAEKLPLSLPPREGVLLKSRFRRALLGPGADTE